MRKIDAGLLFVLKAKQQAHSRATQLLLQRRRRTIRQVKIRILLNPRSYLLFLRLRPK